MTIRDDGANRSSDRQFGLVMAGFFTILAMFAAWRGAGAWFAGWSFVAAAFLVAALRAPARLKPLNRLWFRFGLVLHKVMTPVVMALLFFGLVTPIALLMRLFGQRPIPMGLDRSAKSYWIARDPAGPGPMTRQY